MDADFCAQAHAAEWLSRPLPPPAPVAPVRAGWRERSFGVALAFCVLWGLGLMLLGAYVLVRLFGGWS